MATIYRFQVPIAGFPGAPGVNTFWALAPGQGEANSTEVNDFSQQLLAMYTALRTYAPLTVTWYSPEAADAIDVASGELTGRVAVNTPWQQNGGDASTSTSRATMIKHRYITDRVWRGRFVRGGIFFGPTCDAAIAADGSINTGVGPTTQSAYDGLLDIAGDLRLAVYSHPKDATPTKPASPGQFAYVQSVSVMPVPAVLRSRRD